MKPISGSRKGNYLIRLSIFLITAVSIAGTAGCDGCGYDPPPSQNLEIRSWYDLDAIRNNLAGDHILMNDLDSTTSGYTELASPTAHGGKGWQPVVIFHPHGPTAYTGFMGTFDGHGYEISGLFIDRGEEGYVGLFGAVDSGGVTRDIGMVNVCVISDYDVGGLVGKNDGTVRNSYSIGNTTGRDRVGGLFGSNTGSVSNSYSTGTVTGEWGVGGLGGDSEAIVRDSHFTGTVTANDSVGGLVGDNRGEGIVSNSYSTGSVTGTSRVGGLVGSTNYGVVSNSFWDIETSGQFDSAGGTGQTTAQIKNITTFSGVTWNITAVANPGVRNRSYVWNIVNGVTYPFLSWQP